MGRMGLKLRRIDLDYEKMIEEGYRILGKNRIYFWFKNYLKSLFGNHSIIKNSLFV
jgi:hypothetical protein